MAGHNHICCNKEEVKRGLWTLEEDEILRNYITENIPRSWSQVPKEAGLQRCSKSCRLRWINYLRPNLKRGGFTCNEISRLIELQGVYGNRWSFIVKHFPGRTDNEIKNIWSSSIKNKINQYKISKSPKKLCPNNGSTCNYSHFLNPKCPDSMNDLLNPNTALQGSAPALPPPPPIPSQNFIPLTDLSTWPDFSHTPQAMNNQIDHPLVSMPYVDSLFGFNNCTPIAQNVTFTINPNSQQVQAYPMQDLVMTSNNPMFGFATSSLGQHQNTGFMNTNPMIVEHVVSNGNAFFGLANPTTIFDDKTSLMNSNSMPIEPVGQNIGFNEMPFSSAVQWQFVEPIDGITNNPSAMNASNFGVDYSNNIHIDSLMEVGSPFATMPPLDFVAATSSSLLPADISDLAPLPYSNPFIWETDSPQSWGYLPQDRS